MTSKGKWVHGCVVPQPGDLLLVQKSYLPALRQIFERGECILIISVRHMDLAGGALYDYSMNFIHKGVVKCIQLDLKDFKGFLTFED